MKFYLGDDGIYYRARGAAPKGVACEPVEVGVDKDTLLGLLNRPAVRGHEEARREGYEAGYIDRGKDIRRASLAHDPLCSETQWNEAGTRTVSCEERIEEARRAGYAEGLKAEIHARGL